jgi:GWxTD domain-containing protein
MLAIAACHRAHPDGGHAAGASMPRATPSGSPLESRHSINDVLAPYRSAGFLVGTGELPFVGSVAYLAGPTPDSTLALLAFSLPSKPLSFNREADRFHAAYDVVFVFSRDSAILKRVLRHEDVRVASFAETTRDEESVIFQQFVLLPPGPARVSISARDGGSTHVGIVTAALQVPRFDSVAIAPPVPVLRAQGRTSREARPQIIANPRATAVFGRDSAALFYVEVYGLSPVDSVAALQLIVSGDGGTQALVDTVATAAATPVRGTIVAVPVNRLGLGVMSLSVGPVRGNLTTSTAPVTTPLLVGVGDGLAVMSFDELLGYLRFFTSSQRLRALREASSENRIRAWTSFVEATDPVTSTPENEALRDYFARLTEANKRFAEDATPGWLTDRGMVLAALGEPDNVIEPGPGATGQRSRVLVWEYQRYRARLVFVDQTGFDHWRLTVGSDAEYRALVQRLNR